MAVVVRQSARITQDNPSDVNIRQIEKDEAGGYTKFDEIVLFNVVSHGYLAEISLRAYMGSTDSGQPSDSTHMTRQCT